MRRFDEFAAIEILRNIDQRIPSVLSIMLVAVDGTAMTQLFIILPCFLKVVHPEP